MIRLCFTYVAVLIAALLLSSVSHASLSIDTQIRLIAGYNPQGPEANSPEVLQITQSSGWKQAAARNSMAAVMRNSAGFFSPAAVAKMSSYFAANTAESFNNARNVLYFFGGADALYPSVLFPNQKRLLIVGLETPGQIFDAERMAAQGSLVSQMSAVATAWKDLVTISFFITKHMSTDLQQFGTSTMIAVGLVARGNTITSVQAVSLDRNGQLTTAAGRERGVQIQYVKPNGQRADVIYFSMDLSDGSLRSKPEFVSFVQNNGFDTAYYKAASYVSHNHGFEGLNRLVLNTVQHVVENDDGIPFDSLRENAQAWDLKLFGIYSTPSQLFGAHVDQDLLTEYDQAICASNDSENLAIWRRQWRDACHRPQTNFGFASLKWGGTLPFRYGYTWQTSASGVKAKFSNMIVLDRH